MKAEALQQHMEVIYSRCRRMLGDPEQAWDALQEVFTRYYEAAGRQEIREPLRFLYRSSTNYCIDQMRTKGRMFPLESQTLERQESPHKHRGEGLLIVGKLVQRFGAEAVELMTYRYVDQMTLKEIGGLTGMSDRGVQKKIDRIEEMMRKYLSR